MRTRTWRRIGLVLCLVLITASLFSFFVGGLHLAALVPAVLFLAFACLIWRRP